jgi:hypothetical protein
MPVGRLKFGEKMIQRTILLLPEEMEKIQRIADEGKLTVNDIFRVLISEIPANARYGIVRLDGDTHVQTD